jgi:hypothetical protein
MESFDAIKINEIMKTITLVRIVGIMIVTTGVSLIPDQSSNATSIDNVNTHEVIGNTTLTNSDDLNPVLGSMFLNGTDALTSFNPINKTFTLVSYAGERIIKPPQISNITINATESGNLSMIHYPSGITIVNGQSLLTTNNHNTSSIIKSENASVILMDLNGVRNDDPRSSTGVAFFKTNSTGYMAFLDNLIAIYQVNASPEGTDIRMWEWKGADILYE